MTSPLSGRRALVTGASSGIGAATARALRDAGARVAVGARRVDRLEGDFAAELDVTDRDSSEAFVKAAVEALGGLDILVNNAGVAVGKDPFPHSNDEAELLQVDTNLLAAIRMTRLCLAHMRERGHIVNVGSFYGRIAPQNAAVYAATKFGLRGFSYALREDLLGQPIRVTIIDPGTVATEAALVLFGGDEERAASQVAGVNQLSGKNVADCVVWSVSRPANVNIDEIVIKPIIQSVHRTLRDESG